MEELVTANSMQTAGDRPISKHMKVSSDGKDNKHALSDDNFGAVIHNSFDRFTL